MLSSTLSSVPTRLDVVASLCLTDGTALKAGELTRAVLSDFGQQQTLAVIQIFMALCVSLLAESWTMACTTTAGIPPLGSALPSSQSSSRLQ